jgi:hypothetical protein
MYKLVLILAMPLLVLPGLAQSRNCLRVMTAEELVRNSSFISRVKVRKVAKANYRGGYYQVATLVPLDVIDGDFTLREVHTLARASVRCAEDNYIEKQEMLVFLVPEDSLFRTQNFQYGQFPIDGEIVRGWRDKANKPVDRIYAEVRLEIEGYVNATHRVPTQEAPPPPVRPKPEPQN